MAVNRIFFLSVKLLIEDQLMSGVNHKPQWTTNVKNMNLVIARATTGRNVTQIIKSPTGLATRPNKIIK